MSEIAKNANAFHILIVDDEKLNIELAAVYLQEEGYKLSFALNAKSALESIKLQKIDLILLDINMPVTDGFEVCRLLKEDKETKDIPIVFLTAQTDIKYISRAFEVGGVDYISKPFNGVELKARVKTHLQSVAYLDEIKEKQSKLAQLSITDPLTKLYNTLYFDAQMKSKLTNKESFWFVYIKIDRFDKINEIYGFDGANKVIKNFATLLEQTSFANTTVARLYGIGFGLLFKNYEPQVMKDFYEKLFTSYRKNSQMAKVFSFSTVLYSVKNPSVKLQAIYKKVQMNMHTIEGSDNKYVYIK